MADNVPLGMEFMRWQNVPSISEAFTKMGQGQFNPVGYAIGYGLDKAFGGENEYVNNLKNQQEQAFKSTYVTPIPPAGQPTSAQPPIAAPAVPSVPSAAPPQTILPTYDDIRSRIQKIIGGGQ